MAAGYVPYIMLLTLSAPELKSFTVVTLPVMILLISVLKFSIVQELFVLYLTSIFYPCDGSSVGVISDSGDSAGISGISGGTAGSGIGSGTKSVINSKFGLAISLVSA